MKIISRIFNPKIHTHWKGTHVDAFVSARGDMGVCPIIIKALTKSKKFPKNKFKLSLHTDKPKIKKKVKIALEVALNITKDKIRFINIASLKTRFGAIEDLFIETKYALMKSKTLTKIAIKSHPGGSSFCYDIPVWLVYEEIE